ncbi:MAG TPA: 50S ribosomal protein L13 [Spirochaetia bacterium]|nr:50S ribosomal protein L13 [Spirochaetia bacterium]
MDTIFVKPKDVERKWYVIDASGKRLGKVAVEAVKLVRGKHKALYTPHQEIGDYVIIVNADKVTLSGTKPSKKVYYHHTGFVGGLKSDVFNSLMEKKPTFPLEQAIRGMLPKGPLGRKLFKNVKVYAGAEHPHAAQKPEVYILPEK